MTVQDWLHAALGDADRRGIADLKPLLENLARATEALRAAPWNTDAAADLGRLEVLQPYEGGS